MFSLFLIHYCTCPVLPLIQTIGHDFAIKEVAAGDKVVQLQIWVSASAVFYTTSVFNTQFNININNLLEYFSNKLCVLSCFH